MKTRLIYMYNGRDILDYGKTFDSNSVTKLICEALTYIDIIRSKINEDHSDEHYLHRRACGDIYYSAHIFDTHGIKHSFMFIIKGSPATLRKARKYFDSLGILPF